jgi:D-alanine-D-alanine ligase
MSLDQNIPANDNEKRAELKAPDANLELGPGMEAVILTKPENANFTIDKQALKKLKLVAVAYSSIERDCFPSEEAYHAEIEVEQRALEVIAELEKLGIPARGYPGDAFFMTKLLVDKPDLVLNLVDTLRGKDVLQTSVPAALELANTPYTGAGMQGLVIGNDRNIVKQMLIANHIPTPPFQFIHRRGTAIDERLGLPLIIKLNESGGSVGIDNHAVKETREDARIQVDAMISEYRTPVIVEKFIDGLEITVVVFEDSHKRHIFLGQKVFGFMPDGIHSFTSLESYGVKDSYHYQFLESDVLARKITRYAETAFTVLRNRDYAKFDVRVEGGTHNPYFIDANPNTAFGPNLGLPFTEVLALYGVPFSDALASLMSKYARKIKP